MRKLRVVDLFSGCGGFTLGTHVSGMKTALAVDLDPILSSSFVTNFPGVKLYRADAAKLTAAAITREAGGGIDGLIGGPPCQGFSEIGRQEANDPRRLLVGHFFRLVEELEPRFFVMENVRGLIFENNREVLDSALAPLRGRYRLFEPTILEACDFGAPTRRPRLFVVGFRHRSDGSAFDRALDGRKREAATVREAIADLVRARPDAVDEAGFDWWRYPRGGKLSRYAAAARADRTGARLRTFSGHRRTQHTDATAARFATLPQGAADRVGKHIRLKWDALAPTIRAGTGADRGSYQAVRPIHPTEARVITPREAARLQGFPDWFVFHPTVWHSFRMIGNSVSPLVASAVMGAVAECLDRPVFAEAAE